jgi:hypothetical protein
MFALDMVAFVAVKLDIKSLRTFFLELPFSRIIRD